MKLLLVALFSIFSFTPAYAAYNTVSLGSSVVIQVGSYTLNISGSNSVLESLVVGTSNFSVTLNSGSMITVTSSGRNEFSLDTTNGISVTNSCSSAMSTLAITYATAISKTVVITPLASLCVIPGSSVSVGGGGGSSRVSSPSPIATLSPTPLITPSSVLPAGAVAAPQNAFFSTNLSLGNQNDDVRRLQQLLASDKGIYPLGLVSGYFGNATKEAVKKFQVKYGLPPAGVVGPMTRAKLAEVFGGQMPGMPTAPPAVPSTSGAVSASSVLGVSAVFTKNLTLGEVNSDVKRLQQLLNSDPDTQIAVSGSGSLGNEGEYFGALTQKAIQKFQVKYSIAKPGESGYGRVGPMTRAKLAEIFGR